MKIIALPDLHNHVSHLEPLHERLKAVDLVLLPGDLTNGQMDRAQRVMDTIRSLNENVLSIPGNMDTPKITAYLAEEGSGIHCSTRIIDGIVFTGIGGSLLFAGSMQFTEGQMADMLAEVEKTAPANLPEIMICHQPPINTLNDDLENGNHVGSTSVRAYIERRQPLICFTGHVHEGIGIDTIGSTQIINPGPSWRHPQYAYAEIGDGAVELLEIRRI